MKEGPLGCTLPSLFILGNCPPMERLSRGKCPRRPGAPSAGPSSHNRLYCLEDGFDHSVGERAPTMPGRQGPCPGGSTPRPTATPRRDQALPTALQEQSVKCPPQTRQLPSQGLASGERQSPNGRRGCVWPVVLLGDGGEVVWPEDGKDVPFRGQRGPQAVSTVGLGTLSSCV